MINVAKAKFTITSVLFAITGRYVSAPNTSIEYKQKALSEIKECSVYNFVMGEMGYKMEYDGTANYDPVLRKFLCSMDSNIRELVTKMDETVNLEETPILEENYEVEVNQMIADDYFAYYYIVKQEEKQKTLKK